MSEIPLLHSMNWRLGREIRSDEMLQGSAAVNDLV